MISNKPYENFINFVSSISVPSQTSKLLCNLKIEIEKFPSIKELIQIYEANFLVKENANKTNSKKKWRHDESILFVFILVAYCETHKRETDDLVLLLIFFFFFFSPCHLIFYIKNAVLIIFFFFF